MAFFQNPRRDAGIIAASCIAIAVAWFGIPAGVTAVKQYQWYRAHSVRPVSLSVQEKKDAEERIRKTRNDIRANNKTDNSSRARSFETLGNEYEYLGFIGKAARAYRSALSFTPKETSIVLKYAGVLQLMQDFKTAEEQYRKAIDQDPVRIESYQKLADMYFYDLKDSETARGVYVEGLIKSNSDLGLMKLFANFLELAGNRSEAMLYWEAVLQKDQQNKVVEQHLNDLRTMMQKMQ